MDRFPRASSEIELQEAGRELLVHVPSTKQIHVLNETAGAVLRLCDGAHDVAAIVDAIAGDCGGNRAIVQSDVTEILDEFGRMHLLHERSITGDSQAAGQPGRNA